MRAQNPHPDIHRRNQGLTMVGPDGPCFNGVVRTPWAQLDRPLRARKPRIWAVWNDLFHDAASPEFLDRAFAVMALCPQHAFLVLTKRPGRMYAYIHSGPRAAKFLKEVAPGRAVWAWPGWPLPNVWLGVTAENQRCADERIPALLDTPAAVRFVSCEPLVGPLDLQPWLGLSCGDCGYRPAPGGRCEQCAEAPAPDGYRPQRGLDWVIAGGESGPRARPTHPDWFRSLRDQCQAVGVPFFFKAWGEWGPVEPAHRPLGVTTEMVEIEGETIVGLGRVGRKKAGRLLDGRIWQEFPERTAGA